MNTALIASLSTAIADYESAWRAHIIERAPRNYTALNAAAEAVQAAEAALTAEVGALDAQTIRGALIMAAARVRGERPAIHRAHLDSVEAFINDCIGGNA